MTIRDENGCKHFTLPFNTNLMKLATITQLNTVPPKFYNWESPNTHNDDICLLRKLRVAVESKC